ncbi:peptide/nickel transport system ATP-binding protein [Sanguibacter gelidistatuariae]|uniref:Peptide/nickel transport system ATP-binding protein n=1 Tax=Sanguibacter gelidistatuariae TaxID=1814289 RepID=A0A1G6JAE7_9MICO|nr:ATP-binding cassette domain-containing protein [Sanguibacter gelidistatuariae]SDC15720.1 peptide/nickel transport system ATP-binding protein [Sanguibacter gelidistatuariae]
MSTASQSRTSIPRLEVRGLQVSYGATRVVHGVSFAVQAGSVVGVVGESGSGKTTIARVIAGELEPSAGAVLLDGHALGPRTRELRRAIQVVYQDPFSSLNPRMTVVQVLAELLRVHKIVPRAQIRGRCAELMDLVRLPASVLDAYPRQLSGGQRQRVAIARALALGPRILVADEPTSALDVSVQRTVLDLLADLQRTLGLTIVLISHDLAVIHRLCDRVVVMRAGEIVEDSGAQEFFAAPRSPYSQALLDAAPRLAGRPADL